MDNCFSGNVYKTSMPADLSPWSCSLDTTPNPDPVAAGQLLGIVVKLQGESLNRKAVGQPAAPPQPTMPGPCAGPPKNPLCR